MTDSVHYNKKSQLQVEFPSKKLQYIFGTPCISRTLNSRETLRKKIRLGMHIYAEVSKMRLTASQHPFEEGRNGGHVISSLRAN